MAGSLVVLSVLLAVFAIREASRERLLKDKETAEGQRRLADTVADLARKQLSAAEQRIEGLLRISGDSIGTERFAEVARAGAQSEALIDEIFLLDEDNRLTILNGKPLYGLSGDGNPGREVSTGTSLSGLLGQAEAAEFKTRRYADAVALYQKLRAESRDEGIKALLLSRIGRCREKAGNPRGAIDAYRTLLETSPPDLVSEGIPLAVIACHQLEKLYRQSGRTADAAEALLGFRAGLLGGGWPLTRSRFDFYMKDCEESFRSLIQELDAAGPAKGLRERWEQLETLKASQAARMAILEGLSRRIVPQVALKRTAAGSARTALARVSGSAGGRPLLVSALALDDRRACLLLVNPGELAGKLIPSDPDEHRLREGWRLQIADESGRLLAGDGVLPSNDGSPSRPVLSRDFDENFPPWKIVVYQSIPDSSKRQFLLRRNVYILSAAVVIAALFLGGFLAIRSTAKELHLAKLKSDFVSTVSHEFRTPLMSIRYLAELLERGRVESDERKREYYGAITSESERLARLIENILDFSKIEAGLKKYQAEEVNIAALVADVASGFKRQSGLKPYTLETSVAEGLPVISGDGEALSRALFNLLDNSVKYSGDSPSIVLRAWSDGMRIFLRVEDDGIGIAKDEQRKVFEKFYRSDEVLQGNIKGSGIGLTLVDRIVKAHGGRVGLESEPGRGTRVTIEIPVRGVVEKAGKGGSENGSDTHR